MTYDDLALAVHASWIPINPPDVPALESLLEDAEPFVATTFDAPSPYRLKQYRENVAARGEPVYALLDRNLVSRIANLADGASVDHTTESARTDRIAAATMAFLAAADVELEPNVSLFELTRSRGASEALSQLALFRLAQVIPPQAFLNVALQRCTQIHPDALQYAREHSTEPPVTPPASAFEAPLRQFVACRAVLTKVAILKRTRMSREERVKELFQWSCDEAFFSGIAAAFAMVLFGTKGTAGMLKGVDSKTIKRCMSGIENSAWDLTYIAHWIARSRADSGQGIWLFCTNDKLCAAISKAAVGRPDESCKRLLLDNYPPRTAERLYASYEHFIKRASLFDPREETVAQRLRNIDILQANLEKELATTFDEAR